MSNDKTGIMSFPVIGGLIMLVFFALVLTILAGIVFSFVDLSEKQILITAKSIVFLSIGLGAAYAGRTSKKKGWLNGAMVGIIALIIFFVIGILIMDSGIAWNNTLIRLVLAIIIGAVGGMFGIIL